MHVAISILLLIALVFGVVYFLPDSCTKGDDGNNNPITDDSFNGTVGVDVTSGKVKADIVDAADGTTSLVGQKLLFADEVGGGMVLFQPGSIHYTQPFQVKCTGNLPIYFTMNISRDDSLDMVAFAEAFDFYVVTDPTDLSTGTHIHAFEGILPANTASENFYIVVVMHEDAGNEFQDKVFTGIGVQVNATNAPEE